MPDRPRTIDLGYTKLVDVRHLLPAQPPGAVATPLDIVNTFEAHHDGVLQLPGDHDYNGTTLDEDIERLQAIHAHAIAQGWGSFPYHFDASPNGRTFYTLDIRYRGSHAKARNSQGRAVVLNGDFTHSRPLTRQLCAAGLALALLRLTIGVHPVKAHTQLPSPAGDTECPGRFWRQWKPALITFQKLHHHKLLDHRHTIRANMGLQLPQEV